MKNILFVYNHDRTFVMNDYEILKKNYNVTPFSFDFKKIKTLNNLIKETDIIYIWFASYHAFISTILNKNKPLIVVTGGFDVAKEREINYGLLRNPLYKEMVRYVLNKATVILPVSFFNLNEIDRHFNNQDILNKAVMIYNGVDHKKFIPKGRKQKICLTVGYVTRENWIRKGLKTFVEIGKQNQSGYSFVVVGKIAENMKQTVNEIEKRFRHIHFTGYESEENLLKWFQKSKYYFQLSRYESFGLSLAESMACNCIPIIAENGALPEVTGFKTFTKGSECRKHIINNFTLEEREKELINLINDVIE